MPSLSDKLKALGVKVGASDIPSPTRPRIPQLEQVLGGQYIPTPLGETFLVEQRYPSEYRHGQQSLMTGAPLDVIAGWNNDPRLINLPPQSFVFLDTETTGLSGGTGTYAFLIGVGRFFEDEFVLAQFFMRDPIDEPAQLYALEAFIAPCQALVTFNGKSFDLPLLTARFTNHGLRSPFSMLSHVDLLHLARRLWRERLPSRTLGSLEYAILGILRTEEDIPGWMIPSLYFDYLRSSDPQPLKRVFYHNAMDIVSLAALFNHVASLLADPLGKNDPDPLDEIAIARIFHDLGDLESAIRLYHHSLQRDLPNVNFLETLERLAMIYKRQGDLESAVATWQQAAAQSSLPACIELAKVCEHRLGELNQALEWTLLALALLDQQPRSLFERNQLRRELEHRQLRLERKLGV